MEAKLFNRKTASSDDIKYVINAVKSIYEDRNDIKRV